MLRHDLPDGSCLRLLEEQDADELAAVIHANGEYLAAWMPWVPEDYDRDSALEFIRRARQELADSRSMQLGVTRAGAIVGVAGLHAIDHRHLYGSVGYWLAAEAQGHGTMTLAVAALCDHAFGTWRLHRVEIRAAPDNARSRAIPERLGFQQEGVVREVERFRDRWRDHVVYGMLASEWREAKGY
jgi:ribosomal-protein-serine acetyltransferase